MNFKNLSMSIKPAMYQYQKNTCKFVILKFENLREETFFVKADGRKKFISVAISGLLLNYRNNIKFFVEYSLLSRGVWKEKFFKFANFYCNLKILKRTLDQKIRTLSSINWEYFQVIVLSYEYVCRVESQIEKWRTNTIVRYESFKIKIYTFIVFKSMQKFSEKIKCRAILTETVIINKVIYVFSKYKFLDSQNFYKYRNYYLYLIGHRNQTSVFKDK